MNKAPAYRLETERLLMRCWDPADAPALRRALDRSDQHLRPWIPFMKDEPRTLSETADWLRLIRAWFDRDENYRYAVFEKDSGELAGENMLLTRAGPDALEIGYLTHLGFDGKGYANEATCAMIRVAFEIQQAGRVEIHCSPDNAASAAIPARLGFTHEANLRNRIENTDGSVHDAMIWTMLADEFPGSPASQLSLKACNCLGEEILSV
jgi:RimJ/RimL family protein N-acetyltransferase